MSTSMTQEGKSLLASVQLITREKIVLACLGNANKPLLVEEAKAAYLTRVLQNIALNVEYIAYMDNYETFMRSGKGHNYSFVNQTDLREIINRYTEQLHPAITTFFLPHKEDALRNFDTTNNPKPNKRSKLVISSRDIKFILEDRLRSYVSSRDVGKENKTLKKYAYYIKPAVYSGWHLERETIRMQINTKPFVSYDIQRLILFGLDDYLLSKRIEVARRVIMEMERTTKDKAVKMKNEDIVSSTAIVSFIGNSHIASTETLIIPIVEELTPILTNLIIKIDDEISKQHGH